MYNFAPVADIKFNNCTLIGGPGHQSGGAVSLYNHIFNVTNSIIKDFEDSKFGGIYYSTDGLELHFENVTFTNI